MNHPLCFVLMPFGTKLDASGTMMDFDAVYQELLKPAIEEAELDSIRADEEQTGGIIHTAIALFQSWEANMKHKSMLITKFFLVFSMCLLSSGAMGQTALWHPEQVIREATQGLVIMTQGFTPPLRPKPGHIIGRVVDRQGRPMINVQFYIEGSVFGTGDPFEEVGRLVTPRIDPRSGYYEIRVPDGIYSVKARFDQATTAQLGSRIDCLLLDYFKSADGEIPNALYHSRNGIVKDFIWMPTPQDIAKCMR